MQKGYENKAILEPGSAVEEDKGGKKETFIPGFQEGTGDGQSEREDNEKDPEGGKEGFQDEQC